MMFKFCFWIDVLFTNFLIDTCVSFRETSSKHLLQVLIAYNTVYEASSKHLLQVPVTGPYSL